MHCSSLITTFVLVCEASQLYTFHADLITKKKNSTYATCMSARHLAAEGAGVFGMLADLNLLHHLPEGRTVTGAVLPHNSHLLGALGLRRKL